MTATTARTSPVATVQPTAVHWRRAMNQMRKMAGVSLSEARTPTRIPAAFGRSAATSVQTTMMPRRIAASTLPTPMSSVSEGTRMSTRTPDQPRVPSSVQKMAVSAQ
jgi:hypothetical protein